MNYTIAPPRPVMQWNVIHGATPRLAPDCLHHIGSGSRSLADASRICPEFRSPLPSSCTSHLEMNFSRLCIVCLRWLWLQILVAFSTQQTACKSRAGLSQSDWRVKLASRCCLLLRPVFSWRYTMGPLGLQTNSKSWICTVENLPRRADFLWPEPLVVSNNTSPLLAGAILDSQCPGEQARCLSRLRALIGWCVQVENEIEAVQCCFS